MLREVEEVSEGEGVRESQVEGEEVRGREGLCRLVGQGQREDGREGCCRGGHGHCHCGRGVDAGLVDTESFWGALYKVLDY